MKHSVDTWTVRGHSKGVSTQLVVSNQSLIFYLSCRSTLVNYATPNVNKGIHNLLHIIRALNTLKYFLKNPQPVEASGWYLLW